MPRIHGELLKLGFEVSERSVSRWIRRAPRDPDSVKRWLTFLRNHREAIAAMDFFTVPTLTFGVLYCFFVIGHDRRKILHFNVTRNPSALWVVQQLRLCRIPDYAERPHHCSILSLFALQLFGIVWRQSKIEIPIRTGMRFSKGMRRRDALDRARNQLFRGIWLEPR